MLSLYLMLYYMSLYPREVHAYVVVLYPPPKSSSLEEDLVASLRLNINILQLLSTSEVAADEDLTVDRILSHVELHDIR